MIRRMLRVALAASAATAVTAPQLRAQDSSAYRRTVFVPQKDGTVAFALSFLLPGLGQIYAGEPGLGAALMGMGAGGIVLAVHNAEQIERCTPIVGYVTSDCSLETRDKGLAAAGLLMFGTSWLYSMIDAPSAARRFNEQHRVAAIVRPMPGGATGFGVALSF